MYKLLYVFCILSITSMCNGRHSQNVAVNRYSAEAMHSERSQNQDMKNYMVESMNSGRSRNVEMKSYLVKPMNSRQLQALLNFRDTENQYFFQGGSMEINKPHRVIFPRELNDEFLAKMQKRNLDPRLPNDYYDNQHTNFIIKQRLADDQCTKQLGEACLENDNCCEGSCKPITSTSRSCQN